MASLDALPPDQRAVLQLVLRQGRSYEEIAGLLGLDAHAVRGRAHMALAALDPDGAARLAAGARSQVGDYLLGELPFSQRDAARSVLERDPDARKWAIGLAGELNDLAQGEFPEIPGPAAQGEQHEPAEHELEPLVLESDERYEEIPADAPVLVPFEFADERVGRQPQAGATSSRLGGVLLIGGIAVLLAVVVVLLIRSGDDDAGGAKRAATPSTARTTTTPAGQPRVISQINLKAGPAGGAALGAAQVLVQGNQVSIAIVGDKLTPNKDDAYAVWLYTSPEKARRLGFSGLVGKDGRLGGVQALPEDASSFKRLIITRETEDTDKPGPIVLTGRLDLGGSPSP